MRSVLARYGKVVKIPTCVVWGTMYTGTCESMEYGVISTGHLRDWIWPLRRGSVPKYLPSYFYLITAYSIRCQGSTHHELHVGGWFRQVDEIL